MGSKSEKNNSRLQGTNDILVTLRFSGDPKVKIQGKLSYKIRNALCTDVFYIKGQFPDQGTFRCDLPRRWEKSCVTIWQNHDSGKSVKLSLKRKHEVKRKVKKPRSP